MKRVNDFLFPVVVSVSAVMVITFLLGGLMVALGELLSFLWRAFEWGWRGAPW